jgi:DNA-binding beta-propeller fold protein YncE
VKTIGYGIALAALLFGCGDNLDGGRAPCVEESGNACTWAGVGGVFGFNGDGKHRLETELYWTMDMWFAANGTVWIIDWNNHLVRRIDNDIVTTVVGWVDPIFPGDGMSGMGERMPAGVKGTDVKLNHPTDLTETDDGKILVMAWHNHKLREIDPATNNVRIVAGAGAGFAGDGMALADIAPLGVFRQPKGLERTPNGDLYILDQANLRIRKIEKATGMMSTIAGNGMQGGDGDGGPALSAKLNFETGSNPEPSGGLVVVGNKLYVADTLSNRIRVIDLDTNMIDNFAGTGTEGFSGDGGPAATAQLAHPRDLEIGPEGDLYIADTDNNRIRAINLTTGNIRTVAGSGVLGMDPTDGLPATETQLARPFAIEFSPAGDLYISDTINSRILKVTK